jgi:hypothetical protein
MSYVKLLRRTTLVGASVALVCVLVGAFASSAMARECFNKAGVSANICAFANASYTGGALYQSGSGNSVHSYTELGSGYSGCTHVSFNDCASSIDNEGPYTGYYFANAACSGGIYTNAANTGTSFLGSFWNDTFSSDHINSSGGC